MSDFDKEVKGLYKAGLAAWMIGIVFSIFFYLALFAGAAWIIKSLFF